MNRRKFIKSASGLLIPATFGIFVPKLIRAQSVVPNRRKAFQSVVSSGSLGIGLSSIAASSDTWGAGASFSFINTAVASGTLANAFMYADGSNVSICKVGVYSDDGDSIPNSGDLLIATSGTITSSGAAGWFSAAFSSGTITSGSPYWLVVHISGASATMQVKEEAATIEYFFNSSGGFASPPANLTGYNASSGTYGKTSCYVTVV